jgi:ABC-type antimicrobial peptide transport system permease subunit
MLGAAAAQLADERAGTSIAELALLDDLLARSLGGAGASRLVLLLFGAFGGLSLVLAAGGICGIVLHGVGQREHELGIRSALGATSSELIWFVVGKVLRLIVLGIGLGYAAVWALSRSLDSASAGEAPATIPVDLLSLGAVSGLLLFVATLAALLPSRRVARLDPVRALRIQA